MVIYESELVIAYSNVEVELMELVSARDGRTWRFECIIIYLYLAQYFIIIFHQNNGL